MTAPDCTAQYIGAVLTMDSLCRLAFIRPGGARDYIRDPETDSPIIFPSINAAQAAYGAARAAISTTRIA